jgi:cell division protein FtsL
MTRVNMLLMVAVLLSGLYLVRTSYESRRLFTEVDRAQNEARRLEADLQRLQAERHAQATNLRVEKVARERLKMHPITPAITRPVTDEVTTDRAAAAASGGKT